MAHDRGAGVLSAIAVVLLAIAPAALRATSWGTGDCWTYAPARRDPQTRTIVCFAVEDSRLVTIERIVQRD